MNITPIRWLLEDDTGVSSKTILSVMVHETKAKMNYNVPLDTGDFGRCYRLLQHFPGWEERLYEVSDMFPKWEPFVREWNLLKQLYEEDKFDELDKKIMELVKEYK